MKAAFVLSVFLGFTVSQAFGQAIQTEVSTSPKPAANPGIAAETAGTKVTLDQLTPKADVVEKGQFRISGPLVRPFKAKKLREVPKRLFHVINPFARDEESDLKGTQRVSTQAWATTVGWHPGSSAFADPVSHESSMSLISVSRTKGSP